MTRLDQNHAIERINRIVLANFLTIVKDRLFFFLMLLPIWLLKRIVARYFHIEGAENLHNASSKGHAVITFSSHIGPYYLIPLALVLLGKKVVAVMKLGFVASAVLAFQTKKVNALFGENSLEIASVYDNQLLRKLKRSLEADKVVFIMADYWGIIENRRKPVKFLGFDIVPGKGAAWLSRNTNAAIIPVFFYASEQNQYVIKINMPLDIDNNSDINHITQAIYSKLQDQIISSPEKWALWMDYHLMLTSKERSC